jgi:hypothetical protein
MKKTKTLKNLVLAVAISCAANFTAFAQVGIGTTSPNASSVLDLDATDKGLLLPRVALSATTSPSPLAANVAGMVVYNTTDAGDVTPGFYFNTGTGWTASGGGSTVSTQDIFIPAEYEGAAFTGAGIGCLSASNLGAADNYRNAYDWTSMETTDQTYEVFVRVLIPTDFSSWDAASFNVDHRTDTTTGAASIAVEILKADGTVVLASTALTSSATWATQTTDLTGVTGAAIAAPGDVFVVKLTLNSNTGAIAQVSDIKFTYNK